MSSIAAICSRAWVSSRISWKNNFNLDCIGSVACPLLGAGQWLSPTPTHAGSHISPCYISLIDHYSQPYNGPSLCKYNESMSDKVLSHTPQLGPSPHTTWRLERRERRDAVYCQPERFI